MNFDRTVMNRRENPPNDRKENRLNNERENRPNNAPQAVLQSPSPLQMGWSRVPQKAPYANDAAMCVMSIRRPPRLQLPASNVTTGGSSAPSPPLVPTLPRGVSLLLVSSARTRKLQLRKNNPLNDTRSRHRSLPANRVNLVVRFNYLSANFFFRQRTPWP